MATTWPQSTSLKIHRRIILTFILTTVFPVLAEPDRFDLVITDMTMPHMTSQALESKPLESKQHEKGKR